MSRRPRAQLWTVIERNSFSLTFFESHLIWHAFICEINITFIKLFCWDTGWGNSLLLCDKVMSESQCTQITCAKNSPKHCGWTQIGETQCCAWGGVGGVAYQRPTPWLAQHKTHLFVAVANLNKRTFFFQKVFHNKQFLWLIRAAEGAALTSLTLILTTAA